MASAAIEGSSKPPKFTIQPIIPAPAGGSLPRTHHLPLMLSLPVPSPNPTPTHSHARLSQAELTLSQLAYSELLATAKSYRLALAALSSAASSFGSALESCARLKEARSAPLYNPSTSYTTSEPCTANPIMAASGVHHLISNHQHILSETVYRALEVPLLEELDSWRRQIEEEEVAYQKEARERAREIRKSESEGVKLQRAKRWDVAGLRSHLVGLTNKLDAFTGLHAQHAQTLLRESQDMSRKVVDCTSSLVRAEVEIFEGLAKKGRTGGGLEDLLEKGEDPFAMASDLVGHEGNGASTFHGILPPTMMLSASPSLPAPRDSDKQLSSFADEVPSPRDDRVHDERSIFSGPRMDQAMRPFSSLPPPHPAEEQTAFVWESERPVSTPASPRSGASIMQRDEDDIPQKVPSEQDADTGSGDGRVRERRWSVTEES